jgi:hypothetical protein
MPHAQEVLDATDYHRRNLPYVNHHTRQPDSSKLLIKMIIKRGAVTTHRLEPWRTSTLGRIGIYPTAGSFFMRRDYF